MVSDRNVFSFPGQTCSPERVREIEHNIGFELPPKYAELVQSGCCGLVHPDYAHIKGNSPETDDHLVKVLFGNGFGALPKATISISIPLTRPSIYEMNGIFLTGELSLRSAKETAQPLS